MAGVGGASATRHELETSLPSSETHDPMGMREG